jgi:hypothetical protein
VLQLKSSAAAQTAASVQAHHIQCDWQYESVCGIEAEQFMGQ